MLLADLITTRQPGQPARERGLTLLELIVVLTILVALGGLIVPLFGSLADDSQQQTTRATLSQVADAIVGPGGYAEVMQLARDGADTQFVGSGTGLPWPSPAEIAAGRADHPQLHYLFEPPTDLLDYDPTAGVRLYDPVLRIGWRDPWLSATTATPYAVGGTFTATYGEGDGRDGAGDDDLAPIDGWGNPVVIQLPDIVAGFTDEEIQHTRLVSAGPDGVVDTPTDELTPSTAEKNDDVVLYLYRQDPNP